MNLAEIDLAAVQECDYGPALFRARLECTDCPRLMEAGRWYKVDVDLRNDSPVVWPLPEMGAPDVRNLPTGSQPTETSTTTRVAVRGYRTC